MAVTTCAGVAPTQLPADVTRFVGRRTERRQVRAMLGDARLVTLTGFGGVGKTRLALKVAADMRRAFEDGLVFVPLASLEDGSWISEQVAEALGLQGRSQRAAQASVNEFLQSRHVLLLLDNCEHLVEDVAIFTDTLLRTCPRVRVLATGREPLRIAGEAVHQVLPLAVAAEEAGARATDAVALFADRARSAVPGFTVEHQNSDAVAKICRKLEGIPLAIELVVGRLRAMSLAQLDEQLTEHWDVLNRGSRAAPKRHQTMSDCIAWSFNLCTPSEQQLWTCLAVFADGFELDAAIFVATEVGTSTEVADCLLSLVDKSIVMTWETAGVTRFRLLPPLRQWGLENLRELGRLKDLRRRHRDWCVNLTRHAHEEWISPRQPDWIDRLKREAANIRLALEFSSLEKGEAEPGVLMGNYLLEYGLASGLFRQGRHWFDLLLAAAPASSKTRSIALRTACWWAAMQGDVSRAATLVGEEEGFVGALDGHCQALHVQSKALVAMFSGEFAAASMLFRRSIESLEEFDDVAQQVTCYCLLALNCAFMGDVEDALNAHEACLAITEPAGEQWYRSYSLWAAGLAVAASGDFERAQTMQRKSLRLRSRTFEPLGIGLSFEAFAWLTSDRDPERAAKLLGAAEHMWERSETSTTSIPGLVNYHDACLSELVKDLGESGFQEAVAAGRAMSREEAVAFALEEPLRRTPGAGRDGGKPTKRGVLTRRETEIARLVSEGLANQEVADRLVISRRTAEAHVEHILTKLGFTNRNQIAAWIREDPNTVT